MKKIFAIIALASLSLSLWAQGWEDAYLFSRNNYGGTARGIALGNALTAVGGDPGSLIFNPAGSSVSHYSQFTISPGITIATTGAAGTIPSGSVTPTGYGESISTGYWALKFPNMGFILNFDTGNRRGLKRWSFGMVVNTTDDYTTRMNAAGVNSYTTYAGSLASSADGFPVSVMSGDSWYNSSNPSQIAAWVDLAGYKSGIFSGVNGKDGQYIGITEVMDGSGNFTLAGDVYQKYGFQTRGGKRDFLMNWSLNYSDVLYVGANLGLAFLNYDIQEYWQETPADPSSFPAITYSDGTVTRLQSLRMRRRLYEQGTGINLKVGAILVPVPGVRLGAAIQTPTYYNMREKYAYTGEINLEGKYTSPVSSPEDNWEYDMVSPFRFNVGAAVALGNYALVSVDYELCNYGQARFRDHTYEGEVYYNSGIFDAPNADIRANLGSSHEIRAGIEVKPVPGISARAGYNFASSGVKGGYEGPTSAWAFGLGYSTSGALYMDLALRFRSLPTQYLIPYYYYEAPDPSQYWNKVINDSIMTPEIAYKTNVAQVVFTAGWRF